MAQIDPRNFSSHVAKGKLSPIYLFVGEEIFMIDEALAELQNAALGEGLVDFNLNVFYASDSEAVQIKDAVETLPMMASRRVVVVKEAQELAAGELEDLAPLIDDPVDSTTLVFVCSKADMRKKFFKTFESKGTVVKFQKPYDNQLDSWIDILAKKRDLTLGAEALQALKALVGNNLTEINNEMLKLTQYIHPRKEATLEDVQKVVSRTKVESIFELVNCLGRRDKVGSLIHLANLLDHGQNEVGVLALAIRHFRILLLCKEALKEGLSSSQIGSRVGVHGFFIKDYIDQAKAQDSKHLTHVYDILLETDRALKSNPLSSHLWLENLVLQACHDSAKSLS